MPHRVMFRMFGHDFERLDLALIIGSALIFFLAAILVVIWITGLEGGVDANTARIQRIQDARKVRIELTQITDRKLCLAQNGLRRDVRSIARVVDDNVQTFERAITASRNPNRVAKVFLSKLQAESRVLDVVRANLKRRDCRMLPNVDVDAR